jgi:hypothetical protein
VKHERDDEPRDRTDPAGDDLIDLLIFWTESMGLLFPRDFGCGAGPSEQQSSSDQPSRYLVIE